MNASSSAIAGLQESIQQAESAISILAEELKNKRVEIRRCRKALSVLTGQPAKRSRNHVPLTPDKEEPALVRELE